jgi:HPr kinase/phosphorylase
MEERDFTVLDLIDLDLKEHNALNLKCIAGRRGLSRPVRAPDMNRPGLALSGFYDVFADERIQLFGRGESAYLKKLEQDGQKTSVLEFFTHQFPCCIFTNMNTPTAFFVEEAEAVGCPILQTDLPTTEFSGRMLRILSNLFAPNETIHGVLAEVYGIGVLILGDSGVGKSEAALELITYGHRLVTDDVVEIHCINGNILMGTAQNKIIGHHMEIRGMGVINVTHLFGVGAIRDKKQIHLVVQLENWDPEKNYERLGAEEEYMEFLGVKVHRLTIPVKPGRNIPIIIQTAAMNERLKQMGYDSAKEFNRNVMRWIESETAQNLYFGQNDII